MPGGDRTGPLGMGPRTGRGAGFCRGYGVPGYANPWGGRNVGVGRNFGGGFFGGFGGGGHGRGRRNRYFATGVPGWGWDWSNANVPGQMPPVENMSARARSEEAAHLEEQVNYLKREMDSLIQRLDTLKADKKGQE